MEEAVRMDSVTMEGPGGDTNLPDRFPVVGAEARPSMAGVCTSECPHT